MKNLKMTLAALVTVCGSMSVANPAPFYSSIEVPEDSCIASISKARCFKMDSDSAVCAANILVKNQQGIISQVDIGLRAVATFSPQEPRNPFRENTTSGFIGATLEWPVAAVTYVGEEATKQLVLKRKVEKAYQQLLSSDDVAHLKCH